MAYLAKNAAGGVTKFASVTNSDGDEEVKHRVTQSALPAGAATDATLAAARDAVLPSSALYSGQNAAVTTSGVVLAASQACREVWLSADASNNAAVFVGNAAGQFLPVPAATLPPFKIPAANVNLLYVKSATGTQIVNWLARS